MPTTLPSFPAKWRSWVFGCLAAIAGAIGWEATNKALDAGLEYARTNALPAQAVATTPAVITGQVDAVEATNGAPVVVQGPRIVSVKAGPGETICVKTEGCDWPQSGGAKHTMGKLMIGTSGYPNGVYVDAMTPDQMRGNPKTLANAFGSGEHSLDVRQGDSVQVWVTSLDGKRRTPAVSFIWKWRST